MDLQADSAQRLAIYQRLEHRNRLVAILRIAVPALGVIVLAVLLVQIYLSSLTGRFGVGSVSVTRENVTIETPEYAGVLDNGTTYRVWSRSAAAAIEAPDQISLSESELVMHRPSGLVTQVSAQNALLDIGTDTVTIPGIAVIDESSGTAGTVTDSVFDYAAQKLLSNGPVHIDYADGTTLNGVGMTYDAESAIWTFSRVTVTLPYTPGSKTP